MKEITPNRETHRPRKRFGQHFLHDPQVIRRVATAIEPGPDQHLVEIGPGHGAITGLLLEKAGLLHAIEIDRDLAHRLRTRFADRENFRLHCGDALSFDFRSLVNRGRRLRIVGNLPYNISTPVIFHLLAQSDAIEDMTFMLQSEVVDRIVAAPGTAEYGRLSVMVQSRCRAARLIEIGPGAFYPPPRVYSALVGLRVLGEGSPCIADSETFSRLVARAFSHRRKTLRNSLKNMLSEAEIRSAGVDPGARPGTIDLNGFVQLANTLYRPDSG